MCVCVCGRSSIKRREGTEEPKKTEEKQKMNEYQRMKVDGTGARREEEAAQKDAPIRFSHDAHPIRHGKEDGKAKQNHCQMKENRMKFEIVVID